jgi:hypothetical protein
LLNLHRAYFAQALHDSPNDIQRHRYLPSVVAIYRASWRLIHGLQLAWANVPQIMARIHLPWSQALSAAVSVFPIFVVRREWENICLSNLHTDRNVPTGDENPFFSSHRRCDRETGDSVLSVSLGVGDLQTRRDTLGMFPSSMILSPSKY